MDITALIHLAISRKASDLHLAVNTPPVLRVNGRIEYVSGVAPLTPEDLNQAFETIARKKDRDHFYENLELDFAYSIPGVVRLRCNAAMQRGAISLAMRLIPTFVPSFEELHLPDMFQELALKPRGLVVVSGPTGSGKSTTLATMLDYLNHKEHRRIVTIEDPLEYTFVNDKCIILQRELGDDTLSFKYALKHVLRQDPDVIMVGEMRDLETAAAALTIAETGHLVLTTGHAPSASQAVERIIDLFPVHERYFAQTRLASLLIAIVCQTLVPTLDGKGRLPAIELMLANAAVKSLIREGKIHQLPNVVRTNVEAGMQTLDQALVELYRKELISGKTLLAYCNDRAEAEKLSGEININLGEEMAPLYTYSGKENNAD